MFGEKSPLPSKNKLFLQDYSSEKELLQKQCFYWRGIPHKNYFAEISTSHVVLFRSRNDLWKLPMPACVHICKSVLASFPGGPVGENPPANCRGHGLGPWFRKITHATCQGALSQCSTSTEPTCPTPETDVPRVRAPHQERACTQWRRPSTVKEKNSKTALASKSSLHRHSSHKPSGRLLVIMADPRSWVCKCSELWPQETQTRLPLRCREHSFFTYFLFASCPVHSAQHRGGASQMLPECADEWILSPHPGRD